MVIAWIVVGLLAVLLVAAVYDIRHEETAPRSRDDAAPGCLARLPA